MDRWTWAFATVATFAAIGARSSAAAPVVKVAAEAGGEAEGDLPSLGRAGCPAGTAPDNGACVRLEIVEEGLFAPSQANVHHERSGRLKQYEQIPRLPDRPADYDAYRYPIPPGLPGGKHVVSGYDLDRPDFQQRRGATLKHVGHGGVDLPQARGTPVKNVTLEHQEGDAEVVYTGPLFGTSVVTRHTLREGGRLLDYLVLFGHLDSVAPGLRPGALLREGDLVGAVGDTGSPSLVHLHLEVRRLREGIDPAKLPGGPMLASDSVSGVCDPRNVLPLR